MSAPTSRRALVACSALLALVLAGGAVAAEPQTLQVGRGKLLLTGGVSSVEGAAGGGLTPWALTGSYAARGEVGGTTFATRAETTGYGLTIAGIAVSFDDRIEISFARQKFDTRATGVALGLPGLQLRQDIAGIKVRLWGDGVLDSDRWLPQLALGAQAKQGNPGGLAPTLAALGAERDGTDVYISATKLFLAQGVLVNATLRSTKANQGGLLGFGSTRERRARWMPEVSLAKLLRRDVAIGIEWRAKPDNLNPSVLGQALAEDDWADLFIAWTPNKHLSTTLAWVDLGRIAPGFAPKRQTGGYLSVQLAF